MDPHQLPLLLVDIDGVISLFGFDPSRRPPGSFIAVEGIVHYLSAHAAQQLARLNDGFELAWCSGWEERANEHLLAPLQLGAALPHLSFERRGASTAHWKLGAIDAFVAPTRPVAWIDDTHDEETTAWAQRRGAPTLLVRTRPEVGLTDRDVEELLAWARALSD